MKFGVIGTNFVSDFFMNGAAQVADCEVVAVCSRRLENAKAFAEKYEIPNAFDSYAEMAESNLIDAVYIAVPNGLHREVSEFFLSKKIPTFCEKPLAGNAKEVQSMIDCAKENHTYLQEGLIPLYNPNFQILKKNLPRIGKIHQATFNFSKYSSRYDAYLRGENPTTFRRELANGAIMDLGVYVFANCVGIWGKPDRVLSACSLLDTKTDVAGSSIFVYPDFIATLSYSKASDTETVCEISGEDGILIIDMPSQPTAITFIDRKTKTREVLSVPKKENFYYEITEMIKQVKAGNIESNLAPHATSLAVHEVLTDCREQAGIVFPCDE
jgi:predicted dehydrogenase